MQEHSEMACSLNTKTVKENVFVGMNEPHEEYEVHTANCPNVLQQRGVYLFVSWKQKIQENNKY